MAANEYYNPSAQSQPTNHQLHEATPPASAKPPTSLYTNYPPPPNRTSYPNSPHSNTASIDSPYDNPHHSRDSYSSRVASSQWHDDRQYADNIPLKSSQPRPYSQEDAAALNTQYPPSPESQQPAKSRRKEKQGWFSGKITWVVYAATLVQIGVFVGEIIENCELDAMSQ